MEDAVNSRVSRYSYCIFTIEPDIVHEEWYHL